MACSLFSYSRKDWGVGGRTSKANSWPQDGSDTAFHVCPRRLRLHGQKAELWSGAQGRARGSGGSGSKLTGRRDGLGNRGESYDTPGNTSDPHSNKDTGELSGLRQQSWELHISHRHSPSLPYCPSLPSPVSPPSPTSPPSAHLRLFFRTSVF